MAPSRAKENPRRSGAPLPFLVPCFLGPRKASLVPPAIHAAQHERAGRAGESGPRDRLYRWAAMEATASGYGHLTRSRPQDSASNAAAPQTFRTRLGMSQFYPKPTCGR